MTVKSYFWLSFGPLKQTTKKHDLLSILTTAFRPLKYLFGDTKMVKNKGNVPLVFIVGVPRSGTTAIYQYLCSVPGTNYIDNVMHLFYWNLGLGKRISKVLFRDVPNETLKSKHGKTWMYSWHGPSECTPFWNQFFDNSTTHSMVNRTLDKNSGRHLKESVKMLAASGDGPLVIKNLGLSLKVEVLNELFPDALFIYVQRDMQDVKRSVLRVREQMKIKPADWWSIKPSTYSEIKSLHLEQKVERQIFDLRKEMEVQLSNIEEHRILKLDYSSFFADSEMWLKRCVGFMKTEK